MKAIVAIGIGIVISLAVTYLSANLLLEPIFKESGRPQAAFMGYSLFTLIMIVPIAFLLGSMVTGYMLGSQFNKGIFRNAKYLYLPGTYVSIPYIIGLFTAPDLVWFLLTAACLNMIMSVLGVAIGKKIRLSETVKN